ncbi:centromere protein C isoform X1 [Mesocricetus auratus]|uniref:Centromere protein C isoform X1 n=1 Tax=Mesocricetus auratus TaxID=10036 RepID=A0ABM2XKE3_MESAU|nr:centromere protein C isoform X1 [Mesocricetus auratus]
MASSFHLDHLKNYHRRFCRPSRAPNINTRQGQNVLEILQDCFEEQNSTESLLCTTPKAKDNCTQSAGKECQASHSKSVRVSSRRKDASLKVAAEPSEVACGSAQANEGHQKILATDTVSKSTMDSNSMSSEKTNAHHRATNDNFYLSGGSPVVLLDARTTELQNGTSSLGQRRVSSNVRNSVDTKSSNTDISLKTRKRLNFEDKSILNQAEIVNNALDVEDNILEGQERTTSETSQKRGQDLSYEIQRRSKKSFSTLYLEAVKRKSESSIVRHTAAVPPLSSPPNDMKLLEDEFVIDESDRSFASQPWVTIPRKGRHLRHHVPSPENTVTPEDKKSREKPHSVSPTTSISDSQPQKSPPIGKSQPPVENILGTSCTDELENDCRSTENKMHSENAKKTSGRKRTVRQKQRRVSKPNVVEEQLNMGQGKKGKRNMSNIGQDKLQVNSKRIKKDCEDSRKEPTPKKQMPPIENKKNQHNIPQNKEKSGKKYFSGRSRNKFVPEEVSVSVKRRRVSQPPSEWWLVKPEKGSVDRSSSRENESSVVYHNRKKQTKKNQLSKNAGKKPLPSKRQKTESSSRVQKSLNVKGSRESVSSHDEISGTQSKPLENNKADKTPKKSLDISGPTGGSKHHGSIRTSQNVHLKSHTGKYTNKRSMESNSGSGEHKNSIWEESGPSRLKDYVLSGSNNFDVNDEKEQENLDLRISAYNVLPDRNIHHKLVLPSSSPNVRRTKRIRLKPLEYWRGERIDYQERPSGRIVIGIVSPAVVSPKKKAKGNLGKVTKKPDKKWICPDNHEKDRLVVNLDIPLGDPFQATLAMDPETREIVPMDLIRPRDTYQFFVEQHGLKVFKTLDTAVFSTGKLILGPHEEKGKQHVGQDVLVFYVNFGELLCTLHETPYMITTGDSFYVPSGNHYNIKNLLNVESCLLFTQIKR